MVSAHGDYIASSKEQDTFIEIYYRKDQRLSAKYTKNNSLWGLITDIPPYPGWKINGNNISFLLNP